MVVYYSPAPIIEKYAVYVSSHFKDFVYMALEETYLEDDFISFLCLRTGEVKNEYVHQVEIKDESEIFDYLYCNWSVDYEKV